MRWPFRDRRLLRDVFCPTNLCLYAAGLVAVFVGTRFGSVLGTDGNLVLPPWYTRPLEPIGYTLAVTTLVAAVLNHSFKTSIEARFSVVKGAETAGIVRLFGSRASALAVITDQVQRSNKTLDILCVSGTSLLAGGSDVLTEIGRRFNNNNNLHVRALVLDPRSRFAIERSLREEMCDTTSGNPKVAYPDSSLCQNTLASLRQLEMVLNCPTAAGDYSCEARLYNFAAVAMYVRVDNTIFVEQYHLGVPSSQVDSPFTICLGKATPVVEARGSSELAHVMSSHFNYLWEGSKDIEITRGTSDRLRESLADDNWQDKFAATRQAENALLRLPEAD